MTTPTQDRAAAGSRLMLVVAGSSLIGGLGVTAAGTAIAALVAGERQAWGVAIGGLIVTAFFFFGTVVMAFVLQQAPRAALLMAMMTYTLQLLLVLLAFLIMQRTDVLGEVADPHWLAITVAVLTVCWTAGLMYAATRARVPVYDLPDPTTPSTDPGDAASVSQAREAGAR